MLDPEQKKKVKARLKRIEGQVSGIQRMLDRDVYCVEVLRQISAVEAALHQVMKIILAQHMETCVKEAFEGGEISERRIKIQELLELFSLKGG